MSRRAEGITPTPTLFDMVARTSRKMAVKAAEYKQKTYSASETCVFHPFYLHIPILISIPIKNTITMSTIMNSLRPSLRTAFTTARSFSTTSRRDLARMILTGRLGTEPELQATASGREVIRYVVASEYGRTQSRKTDWFRVSSFPDSENQKNFLLNLPKGYAFFCYMEKKRERREANRLLPCLQFACLRRG